jgi:cytochrome c oxidase accessory protein FixG
MEQEEKSFRDKIATVNEKGTREWIFPKKPKGKLYNYRKIVAYFLIALFITGPFLYVQGEPLFLFDFVNRQFLFFGILFKPHDFHLFALALLSFILFIVLFTAVFGRVFCGWACPQTVFMEMVYRRVEYWIEGDAAAQKKLRDAPVSFDKVLKKIAKHGIFILIASFVAHIFVAYLVGKDRLFLFLSGSPTDYWGSFITVSIFTFVFYFVFSVLREQSCTLICPYGRLQGVLIDDNTKVIAFDYKRGEPRAPYKKHENREAAGHGSCINCHSCKAVCPTGIDIKNGTQLECVNCTACIDACNAVMDRTGQPRGLIRWASENEIKEGKKFSFSPRLIFYSTVLLGLLTIFTSLLVLRDDVETTVLKVPGTLYQEMDANTISNLYNYKVVNKTNNATDIGFSTSKGELKLLSGELDISNKENIQGMFMIRIPKSELKPHMTEIDITVIADGEEIQVIHTNFLGPEKINE